MPRTYTKEELERLHLCLKDILREIIRVCDDIGVKYFMVGGSVIGCHFWNDIIPFDDDIDIGMKRDDYERFLREAPSRLSDKYFLQWYGTEPHTPFYFAKVRLDGTLFVEETTRNIPMHQGIYVDILPFDSIPDDPKKRRRQRKLANIINSCFISKDVWLYAHCGRCEVEKPSEHTFLNCIFDRIVVSLVPKRVLYRLLQKVMTWYNGTSTKQSSVVPAGVDDVRTECLNRLEPATFGSLDVFVPGDYEEYLHHHYPKLRKHLTPEEIAKYSHRPVKLAFEA